MTEKALREGYQTAPCLGYKAVGDGKPFLIDEDAYSIVEYIFQAYHSGRDMTGIARSVNTIGYRTQRGNLFDRRAIYRILTNHFYTGEVSWNGITFQGTHETRPAVTSVFDDVQKRITSEYHPKNAGKLPPTLIGCQGCCSAESAVAAWASTAPTIRRSARTSSSAGNTPKASTLAPAVYPPESQNVPCSGLWKALRNNHLEYEHIPKPKMT